MIKCNSCNKEYELISEEDERGETCSAKVENECVIGRYGSIIDTEKWVFLSRPNHVKDGIICDDCVHKLQRGNFIEFDSCGYWK